MSEPYEGLEAEECGILDGCPHGRCVRVPEGFTCDCFDGYRLDITRMSCVDVNECDEAEAMRAVSTLTAPSAVSVVQDLLPRISHITVRLLDPGPEQGRQISHYT